MSKKVQEELFIKFARSIAALRGATEIGQFLKDLLSEVEVLMFARRLQIAELLIEGLTYEQIKKEMKVSKNTIARVQTWLDLYGEGYRTVVSRTRSKENRPESEYNFPFAKVKRKYPAYFWPQLLLEEIVKNANTREKQRLAKVVEQLRDKTQLSKQLMKLL